MLDAAPSDIDVFGEIEGSFREDRRFAGIFGLGAAFGSLVFFVSEVDLLAYVIGLVFVVVCAGCLAAVLLRWVARPRLRFALTTKTYQDRWWTAEPVLWSDIDTMPTTVMGLKQVAIKLKPGKAESVQFARFNRRSTNAPVSTRDFRSEEDFVRFLSAVVAIKHPRAAVDALNKARPGSAIHVPDDPK